MVDADVIGIEDFGCADIEPPTISILLRETEFGRFELADIDTPRFVQTSVESTTGPDNLKSYRIHLRWDSNGDLPHELIEWQDSGGVLRIQTTSKYIPTIDIPLTWQIRQLVHARPAVVDFGSIPRGEDPAPHRSITLRHLLQRHFSYEIVSDCDSFQVASAEKGDDGSIQLSISPVDVEIGFHTEELVIACSTDDDRIEFVQLPCSYLGIDKPNNEVVKHEFP